jgi:hypothetical protein
MGAAKIRLAASLLLVAGPAVAREIGPPVQADLDGDGTAAGLCDAPRRLRRLAV